MRQRLWIAWRRGSNIANVGWGTESFEHLGRSYGGLGCIFDRNGYWTNWQKPELFCPQFRLFPHCCFCCSLVIRNAIATLERDVLSGPLAATELVLRAGVSASSVYFSQAHITLQPLTASRDNTIAY